MKIFTGNFLKIVALVTMLIDHFAFYFSYMLDENLYSVLRIIGRLSMPIFAFLIVEGFCHTKDVKKYFGRLFIFACITQVSLFILDKVIYVYNELSCYNISSKLNILFSFSLAVISLYAIKSIVYCIKNKMQKKSEDINKGKNKSIFNILFYVFIVLIVSSLFIILDFDYGVKAYLIVLSIYLINIFTEIFNKNNSYIKLGLKYFLYFVLFISVFNEIQNYAIFANFALIFIYLYNGKRGQNNKVIKYSFYIAFYLQHIILYSISALIR